MGLQVDKSYMNILRNCTLSHPIEPFSLDIHEAWSICSPICTVKSYSWINSQKRVTHSTIKVLHQPTSSECVTTFPCSLPRACPNDNEGKLQQFAMVSTAAVSVAYYTNDQLTYREMLIWGWREGKEVKLRWQTVLLCRLFTNYRHFKNESQRKHQWYKIDL